MARTVRAADGGLVIPHACPAEIGVLSAGVAGDGRWHLLSSGGGTARCWPAGAGDLTDAPPYAYNWPSTPGSLALASLPGGSDVVVARASHGELLRWDRASGRAVRGPVTHPARQTRSPARRALVIADIPGRPWLSPIPRKVGCGAGIPRRARRSATRPELGMVRSGRWPPGSCPMAAR